ncbi:MAG TPA: elongation factor P [Candidatus Paceibacterota bacterium]
MLDYSEVKPHKFIVLDGVPYEVLGSHVFRKQQRKPVNDTKLRNLITGKVAEISFHQNEKVAEAELDTRTVKFLYSKQSLPAGRQGEYWFCEQNDPAKRFELSADVIGEPGQFLKANMLVDLLEFEGKLLGVKLPIKVELKVTEAPPSIKGNTAQGGNKVVTLETGAQINVPLFVNEGDVIVINTETGEYGSRV